MKIGNTEITKSQIDRFSSLDMAKRVADRRKYIVRPVLGDDGKFWVFANTRLESVAIRAGFSYAV